VPRQQSLREREWKCGFDWSALGYTDAFFMALHPFVMFIEIILRELFSSPADRSVFTT
jgi:hypothetical protein